LSEKEDMILGALARLESGWQSVAGEVSALRKDQSQLSEVLIKLADGQLTLSEELIKIREDVAKLREDQTSLRVGLMERMDRLQNILNSIRDDVTVSMGRGDHAERIALHTREELRTLSEVVSAMHKQIATLQTQVRELRGDP